MNRYHLYLKDFTGDVSQDEEGYEFPAPAAARDYAVTSMQELLAEAIKQGAEVNVEAIVVADDSGRHVASVPVVAALPTTIVNALKDPSKVVPLNRLEEYRRNADGCRSMAENADDPNDKMSWLKLADAWLQMLPKHEPPTSTDLLAQGFRRRL